jgi:hypothetical protein
MEVVDKKGSLFELEEIYKYKSLIDVKDKAVIKRVIIDGDETCIAFYQDFMELVAKEVDHTLNKAQFKEQKDVLVGNMKAYLDNK